MNLKKLFQQQPLERRFLIFLFGVLALVSASFLVFFYAFYHAQISEERTKTSQAVSLLLQSSLERAMLRRDLVGLQEIITDLGQQSGVEEVLILNPAGEVRFAANPMQLGSSGLSIMQEFCPNCAINDLPLEPTSRFFTMPNGQERLRTFHPVRNKPACLACHGDSREHPVNGILVVDYDASPIRQKGLLNIGMLLLAGSVALLFSAWAAWWFMQAYVLQPIQQLHQASLALAEGKLDRRVPIKPMTDEINNLGRTFNLMAEHLQANHLELKEREHFLQDLLDAVPDGVRVIDRNYRIVMANRAYLQQLGLESFAQLQQQPCYQVTHQLNQACPPSLRTCPLDCLHAEQTSLRFMETLRRADGSYLSTEVYAARLVVATLQGTEYWIVEAIRDLDQAVHYSHEQKLAALGELAAGVAHEIHNPLASVQIALQASDQVVDAVSEPEAVRELRDYLHLVGEQVEQCLDVTHRLMKLGSLASNHPELVEVNTVIKETLSLLRFEREQQAIQEQLELADSNPRILAADNDLRMIILNLVQNAFHAMPQGGTLKVRSLKQVGQIIIEIEDTGVGIDEAIIVRIFDPFFSRRQGKSGSGLGLTIARSLVKQHQGKIEVPVHQAGKTLFRVTFPDVDAPIDKD